MNDNIEIIRTYEDAWGHPRDVPDSTIQRLEEALQRTSTEPGPKTSTEAYRCFEPEWMPQRR